MEEEQPPQPMPEAPRREHPRATPAQHTARAWVYPDGTARIAQDYEPPQGEVMAPQTGPVPATQEQYTTQDESYYHRFARPVQQPVQFGELGRSYRRPRAAKNLYVPQERPAAAPDLTGLDDYPQAPAAVYEPPVAEVVEAPEEQLPLLLPEVSSYEPTDNGESPLATMTDWVNTTCPCCGGPAQRETDTMPQWAGSSWYFLRYMDPHNDKALASQEALRYWGQVDWYNGGMEHTTLHLLYSRFWHKFLYDLGVVPYAEPYHKRTSHGMILGEGGEKMSKSRGNVVNPNDVVAQYGADTMRMYIMFIGDFEKAAAWSDNAVKGCKRFLDRIWNLAEQVTPAEAYGKENEALLHKTIKKVSDDIENMKFNTAIAALMTLTNQFYDKGVNQAEFRTMLQLLSPFAPHMADELWERFGWEGMASTSAWPAYDESKTVASEVTIAVQVGGKLKTTVTVATDSDQDAVLAAVTAEAKIAKLMEGKELVKVIHVPNKLVNLILKPKA